MTEFRLKITPAISVGHRHQIMILLQSQGYDIHGSGQNTDDSECDISFSDKKEGDKDDTP